MAVKICVHQGDLTQLKVDAIVNPANSHGWMGGGVAGVIRRRGGSEIEKEAVDQAPIPIGHAVVTQAGSLPCKVVIHAPTMREPAERTNEENVKQATLASLQVADAHRFETLAIPGMGTGIGRVPVDKAACAMVDVVRSFSPKKLKEVILVDINDDMIQAFKNALKEMQ